MSDWSRLYDACKDATGIEIVDIYDAHLIVEELDDKCRKLTKENALLRSKNKDVYSITEQQIEQLIEILHNKNVLNTKNNIETTIKTFLKDITSNV